MAWRRKIRRTLSFDSPPPHVHLAEANSGDFPAAAAEAAGAAAVAGAPNDVQADVAVAAMPAAAQGEPAETEVSADLVTHQRAQAGHWIVGGRRAHPVGSTRELAVDANASDGACRPVLELRLPYLLCPRSCFGTRAQDRRRSRAIAIFRRLGLAFACLSLAQEGLVEERVLHGLLAPRARQLAVVHDQHVRQSGAVDSVPAVVRLGFQHHQRGVIAEHALLAAEFDDPGAHAVRIAAAVSTLELALQVFDLPTRPLAPEQSARPRRRLAYRHLAAAQAQRQRRALGKLYEDRIAPARLDARQAGGVGPGRIRHVQVDLRQRPRSQPPQRGIACVVGHHDTRFRQAGRDQSLESRAIQHARRADNVQPAHTMVFQRAHRCLQCDGFVRASRHHTVGEQPDAVAQLGQLRDAGQRALQIGCAQRSALHQQRV